MQIDALAAQYLIADTWKKAEKKPFAWRIGGAGAVSGHFNAIRAIVLTSERH
jgi:hypothetical protein